VKFRQRGPWIGQHDPDFHPNGTISVFNNNSDGTETGTLLGGSSILELDPRSREITRRYGGIPEQPMYSSARGKHEYLDNGNILITETEQGRILEVTPAGDMVWEYITRYDADNILTVTQATRYNNQYFKVADWSCP